MYKESKNHLMAEGTTQPLGIHAKLESKIKLNLRSLTPNMRRGRKMFDGDLTSQRSSD
jgi:hypothetical protein